MSRRRAQSSIRWIILAAVVVAIGGSVVAAYAFMRPTVTVTQVVEGPAVEAFYATGTLQPVDEYPIKAHSAGLLQKLEGDRPFPKKGDHVTAGQALAIVADAQWQAALDKCKAELDEKRQRADDKTSPVLIELDARISAMQDQFTIAQREENRIVHLLETGGSSQSEFDQALNRVRAMTMDLEAFKAQKAAMKLQVRRELDEAEANLRTAQWNLEMQTLTSPVDGVVLDRPAPVGTRLGVNDHFMQVADVRPETLVMRAQVDEEDITKVRDGQVVRMVLYAFPGQPFEGAVARVYDKADPDRRTFEVDVKPTKPDPKFAAGLTGELAFEVRSKPAALVVPSQAIQDGRIYLLQAGHLHAAPASVGIRGVERAELLSGVHPGDRILITPVTGLKEGQWVREQYMDPVAAAALNKPKEKEVFRGGF
jgi:multidrug efflux pump subunit AcrA (membrane-fusion protein)